MRHPEHPGGRAGVVDGERPRSTGRRALLRDRTPRSDASPRDEIGDVHRHVLDHQHRRASAPRRLEDAVARPEHVAKELHAPLVVLRDADRADRPAASSRLSAKTNVIPTPRSLPPLIRPPCISTERFDSGRPGRHCPRGALHGSWRRSTTLPLAPAPRSIPADPRDLLGRRACPTPPALRPPRRDREVCPTRHRRCVA